MNGFPDDILAAGVAAIGKPQGQTYSHKLLRDMVSGPIVGLNLYDIDKMLKVYGSREPNGKIATLSRVEMAKSKRLFIDESYAASLTPADLKRPAMAITVRHPNGKVYGDVCDGNHRIYQAWRLGHATYPLISLTEQESDACRFPDDFVKHLISIGELK